jgi:nitrate reductase delta subunit
MTMFRSLTPRAASKTLRVLAELLEYPDAAMRAQLADMGDALRAEAALAPARIAEIERLIEALSRRDQLDAEADYVALFDRGRSTSLHLFEHVHGDSRERGAAMVDLAQTYEKAGLYLLEGELPDYLPAVLQFASTQPPREARAFLQETVHILNALFGALQERGTRYASVIGALIELAGESAHPVKPAAEEALDEAWAEPPVFGGCSTKGQARPGDPQPIRIIRPNNAAQGAQQ